jgi:transposase
MPEPVSVGALSPPQGGRENAHTARSARQHANVDPHHRRQSARCKCARRYLPRGGAFYVLDRGCIDFERLYRFTLESAFFVVRTKTNVLFEPRHSHPVDPSTAVRSDQTVILTSLASASAYPDTLRKVSFVDAETGKRLVFLTNNFSLPAATVAALYKQRWQVERFFKWIKQHLRIKALHGTSENAVKTRIWIAVSVYVLVAFARKLLDVHASLYQILQVLSLTLFEKTPFYRHFRRSIPETIYAAQESN